MNDQAMQAKLPSLLCEVFDNDELVATPDLTLDTINGWDSLGKMRLLVEVEEAFAVQFSGADINSLTCVADLIQLIEAKAPQPLGVPTQSATSALGR
jgi:acyl carrier protein